MRCLMLVGILMLSWRLSAFGDAEMERDFTNSIGIKFVLIEPGSFMMGQEAGGDWDERPVHKVNITEPFYMAVTEVTNAQYERFAPAHRELRGRNGFSKDDGEAVVFVSWHEAAAFCQWLSDKEDRPCRLPTEAEWEYACRAGTTTAFHTGGELPEEYHKHQKTEWTPKPASLHVGRTPPNAFGLHDMHGNVEEWCRDWYGPYEEGEQTDPVGREHGDFKVTRGGSHSTEIPYLRSANRMSTLPEDKHWLIGFRVVMGEMPDAKPLPKPAPPLWAHDVSQAAHDWSDGPATDKPYFLGPRRFVKIPPDSNGPMFSRHNHVPALAACPNGDILAIWYSTNTEPGRELTILGSRLRQGREEWAPAAPFWNAADRNDHASALLWDGDNTLYHFNGLGTDGTWGKLALIMRTSTDNGATWSRAQLINPEHQLRNMPIAGAFKTKDGHLVLPCDAVTGGHGGSAIHISRDRGKTWVDPGAGRATPRFTDGATGAWIAGIHAGVAELDDGSLLAFGRGNDINGRMPMSLSCDMGRSWTYSPSEFPPINGGQRLVLMRLREGPLLFVSFTDSSDRRGKPEGMLFRDASGKERRGHGMFAAVSFDEGKTWPVRKLVTPGGPPQKLDDGEWTRGLVMDPDRTEPKGYLAATQTPDGVIHLVSSALHYEFNLTWLKQPATATEE